MTTFFGVGGNPFATAVGQRIEQATDASLASENWALNMEICDIINETEDGPKDAIKALRKRLQQNAGKNYTVVMYTLTVLETCVKNCNKRFHVLVCHKEFIQELVKLIGPKNDPPTAVQEKVLSLIQSWADAFQSQPEMAGVVHIYQDLKLKGIEFPMTDLDAMAPIFTPQRSVGDGEVAVGVPALVAQQQGTLGNPPSPTQSPPPPRLTGEQLTKLHSQLDVVQANMAVMSEMLSELTPGKEHPSDIQLLKELHGTLKTMQQRLVELISKLSSEEVTEELLRVNDLLNNIFLRYSRFENNREMSSRGRESLGAAAGGAASLIDLDITDQASPPSSQLAALSLKGASASLTPQKSAAAAASVSSSAREDSDFDMFAQSRNVTYESCKNGGSSTFEANLKPDQISGGLGAAAQARTQTTMHKESDFDEMAAWLGDEGAPQESLTSSEFERFLAERAAAADALPSTNPSSSSTTSTPQHRHRPRANKDDDASLYAL